MKIPSRFQKPFVVAVDLAAIKASEDKVVLGHDRFDPDRERWGLALSGGGIRSATFSLGVVQTLARKGVLNLFDYQSTVSGGGYIGGFVQALIRRRGLAGATGVLSSRLGDRQKKGAHSEMAEEQRPIQHLREYSNYLTPRKSMMSGDSMAMLGTVLRNISLIQAQLGALILAASLLPLLMFAGLQALRGHSATIPLVLAAFTLILALVLLAWITSNASQAGARAHDTMVAEVRSAGRFVPWLLALGAVASALAMAGYSTNTSLLTHFAKSLGVQHLPPSTLLGAAVAALYLVVCLAWCLISLAHSRGPAGARTSMQRHPLRFLAAATLCAALSGWVTQDISLAIAQKLSQDPSVGPWWVLLWSPTLLMALIGLVGAFQQGVAGPAFSDLEREVWARAGGCAFAMVLLGFSLPMSILVLGPWALDLLAHPKGGRWTAWLAVLGWMATSGAGLMAAYRADAAKAGNPVGDALRRGLILVAPWVFVVGLLAGLSWLGQTLVHLGVGDTINARPRADAGLGAYLAWLNTEATLGVLPLCILMAVAVAAWQLVGRTVNLNEFGLNAFYRNRLVRCYLGASNQKRQPEPSTDFDDGDDFSLAEAVLDTNGHPPANGRPLYPLIGTTLNLSHSGKKDWQDRKAASFLLSPAFCGHVPPDSQIDRSSVGDRAARCVGAPCGEPETLAQSVSLGSAIAISGAAVNPSMGHHSLTPVAFLLTIFNVRLGWWMPNPSHKGTKPAQTPFSARWLLDELFGLTRASSKFVHLSDGGHFENLGLYELVRRRCRLILCVDAGADPDRDFDDLGNAVLKCRVDFGASIQIDTTAVRPSIDGWSECGWSIGTIDYADDTRGVLVYLKPALTGREPADVLNYARGHRRFPHEPTYDQFFGEAQFESYRRLGEFVAQALLDTVGKAAGPGAQVPGATADAKSAWRQWFVDGMVAKAAPASAPLG